VGDPSLRLKNGSAQDDANKDLSCVGSDCTRQRG
jgi:hypothetical protein